MTFIPHNTSTSSQSVQVVHGKANVPIVDLWRFKMVMRIDDTVSDERAIHCVETALITTVADINDAFFKKPLNSEKTSLFLKVIYYRAKSLVIEKYLDIDTTAKGAKQSEDLINQSQLLKQRSRELQRLLVGKTRVQATLI